MREENHSSTGMRMTYVLVSTCIAPLFFMFSCASNNVKEDVLYETYTTFELFFTFSYPKTWSIFENENDVAFSNSVVLLTDPKDKRVFKPQSFLGNVYLSDSSNLKIMYAGLNQYALFLSLSRDGAFGNQKQKIALSIRALQKLSGVITGDAYEAVKNSYERIVKMPLSAYARGYTVEKNALIVDAFLKPSDNVSNAVEPNAMRTRGKIVIYVTAVRKMTDEIFVLAKGHYDTGISAPGGEEDLLLAIARETQHQIFLQDFMRVVQSVEVNDPSLE